METLPYQQVTDICTIYSRLRFPGGKAPPDASGSHFRGTNSRFRAIGAPLRASYTLECTPAVTPSWENSRCGELRKHY